MADPKVTVRIQGEDATGAAFRSALGNARSAADRMAGMFKGAFAGLSVAAVGSSVLSFTQRMIETGDELQRAAVKAGITGRAMSELAYAAKLADVDLGSLSSSIRKMQVNLSQAGSGAKGPIEALAALGLTIKDLKGLDADRQFELIGDRISQLSDPADRARAATELFGKAGADLLPLFEQGAEGIRKAREEAEKFGASLSDEQLAQIAAADEQIKKLKLSFDGLGMSITAAAAPLLTDWADGLRIMVAAFNESRSKGESAIQMFERMGKMRDELLSAREAAGQPKPADPPKGALPGFKPAPDKPKTGRDKGLDLEVRITNSLRAAQSPMEKFFDGLYEKTATAQQRQLASVAEIRAALDLLQQEKGISPEEYQARFSEAVRSIVGDTRTAAEQQIAQIDAVRQQLKLLEKEGAITADQSRAEFAEALESIVGDTRTAAERQKAEIDGVYRRLVLLKDNGIIDAQTLTERYAEAVDRIQGKTEELNQYMVQAQRNTVDIIADTIENGFDGGFKGVLLSFAKMLRSMAAQAAAANLGKVLFGEGGMTPGSIKQGSAGILGDLIKIGASAFGGMFGGGSIGLSSSQTSSMLGAISSQTAGAINAFKIPGYATGGAYAGSPFIAGEEGPELIVPNGKSGRVYNNRDTQKMLTQRNVNITLNLNGVRDADSFRRAEGHVRASLAAAYQRSMARDN